jgi:flagellar assembly factor FliW
MNVKVMTSHFGALEIDDDRIIEMPDGMIGFMERRFILLSSDNNGCFFWFQSVDNPALAFVVTDPTAFVPGYEVTLTPDEYEKLKLDPESAEIILLAVTNIHHDSTSNITINLQGPVVVNPIKMVAKQIVLENGKYGIRHPLFTAPAPEPSLMKKEGERPVVSPQKITALCSNL